MRALLASNPLRDIPASDAPTAPQTSGGIRCQGSFSFSCWTSEACLENPAAKPLFEVVKSWTDSWGSFFWKLGPGDARSPFGGHEAWSTAALQPTESRPARAPGR